MWRKIINSVSLFSFFFFFGGLLQPGQDVLCTARAVMSRRGGEKKNSTETESMRRCYVWLSPLALWVHSSCESNSWHLWQEEDISKGLRAWQEHRDKGCSRGQSDTKAAWLWGPLGIAKIPVETVATLGFLFLTLSQSHTHASVQTPLVCGVNVKLNSDREANRAGSRIRMGTVNWGFSSTENERCQKWVTLVASSSTD